MRSCSVDGQCTNIVTKSQALDVQEFVTTNTPCQEKVSLATVIQLELCSLPIHVPGVPRQGSSVLLTSGMVLIPSLEADAKLVSLKKLCLKILLTDCFKL